MQHFLISFSVCVSALAFGFWSDRADAWFSAHGEQTFDIADTSVLEWPILFVMMLPRRGRRIFWHCLMWLFPLVAGAAHSGGITDLIDGKSAIQGPIVYFLTLSLLLLSFGFPACAMARQRANRRFTATASRA